MGHIQVIQEKKVQPSYNFWYKFYVDTILLALQYVLLLWMVATPLPPAPSPSPAMKIWSDLKLGNRSLLSPSCVINYCPRSCLDFETYATAKIAEKI